MPPEQRLNSVRSPGMISPAMEMLEEISQKEEQWAVTENLQEARGLQEESLALYDRAIAKLRGESEIWLCAWVMLKKASLTVEFARSADPAARMELVDKVIQLSREAFAEVDMDPHPGLDRIAKLCLASIDPLLRIRTLLDQPAQIDAVDELIRALSSHYGEILALTAQMRSRAYDLFFNSRFIESLIPLESDSRQRMEMTRKSRDLLVEAYIQLLAAGDPNSRSLLDSINKLDQLPPGAPAAVKLNCPACGYTNHTGAVYCSQCGARLSEETR